MLCATQATRDAATGCPEPFLLRTYPAPDDATFAGTSDATLAEAVAATSAAPTFFPRSEMDDKQLTDGGVAFNNPSLIALIEAKNIWPDAKVSVLVSLGVGDLGNGKQSHETMTHAHAEAVADELDIVYERFDPPLAAPIGCAEAREHVLSDMERRADDWIRDDPDQQAKMKRVTNALKRRPVLNAPNLPWDAIITDSFIDGFKPPTTIGGHLF